jgi:serine/threonine-protein kinase
LEWIPLKALRKERDRRYATPQQLSEDINNYLEQRPLLAGPETGAYRIRKLLLRHLKGLAVGLSFIVLVCLARAMPKSCG